MTDPVRVLHVDDDPAFADLTATSLEREDDRLTVETATSAGEGLERLDGGFDCVVSDYEMPGRNGLEFLEAVRAEHSDLPVILFTGRGSEEIAAEAISAGVTDYLRKQPGSEQYRLLANRIHNAVSQYRAERELERQGDLFRRAQALADVGAWEWYPQEEEGYYSEQVYEIYGVESRPDRSPETDIDDFYHPEDRERIREAFRLAVERGEAYDIKVRVVDSEGTEKWVRTRGDPEFEDGVCVRVSGTIQDITDREERERELERRNERLQEAVDRRETAETRYRSLFENFPEPTMAYVYEDGEPHVASVNEQFAETFGYDAEAVVGRPIDELVVPTDRHEETRRIDERIRSGESVDEVLGRQTAEGIREFRFRNIGLPEDDRIDGYGIYADVTERKEHERELERANERLEEFVNVVTHDLRNPLNVAKMRVELAREEFDSDHLDVAAGAHDRMETLIEDLLALARNEETVETTEPVDLGALAETCWEHVETGEATLVSETGATIRADEGRLRQLIENLVRNSVEHGSTSPDSQGVTVTIGDLEEAEGFYVADDGCGIPPEDRQTVFESGYSTDDEGTGFGLAIVRRIANAHGWSIEVTRSAADGARFELSGVEIEES